MKRLHRKTSSRKKRRNYTSNIPRYSVDVHISTSGTTQHKKKR